MKASNTSSVLSGLIIGLITSIVINIAMISIFAWLVSKAYIPENKIGYICAGVLILSALVGTLSAVKKVKTKPLIVAIITALTYFLTMISINAVFFEGMYEGVAVTALCVVGSSICGAMLTLKRKKTHKYRSAR